MTLVGIVERVLGDSQPVIPRTKRDHEKQHNVIREGRKPIDACTVFSDMVYNMRSELAFNGKHYL